MTRTSPPRRELEARLGELLAGRFRLRKVLGAGGMGLVFLAIQEPLGRPIAVKVLAKKLDAEAFRQRFLREASVAARLSSPHIVTIHDYGETDEGELFIAMEYVEGVPLGLVLKREGPFEAARLCRLARQLCRGLGVAHDAGVVHRDLKPSNIMLIKDRQGEEVVKILDFGLVKSFTEEEDGELTGGAVLGSPNYMAPEQIRRRAVDQRTDVYAAGVIIYRLLTGHLPFEGDSVVETMGMHLKEAPPPVARYRPEPDFAVRALEAIALRCLEKKPEQRYASMDELQEALEGAERLMRPGPLAPARRSSSSIDLTPSEHGVDVDLTPSRSAPLGVAVEDDPTVAKPTPSPDVAAPLQAPSPSGSTLRTYALGAVALVALSTLVTMWLVERRAPDPEPAPPPAAKVAPPAPPAPPPSVEAPAPKVTLRLTSSPAGATVRRGDAMLGRTPLELELERASEPAQLVFELSGYRRATRELALDRPEVALDVKLSKVRRRRAPPPPKVTAPPANPLRDKLKANPYE